MKKTFIFILFFVSIILTGCQEKPKPKSDYEIFTELYTNSVNNFEELESYTLKENSYFNFKVKVNNQSVNTSMDTSMDYIKEPLYAKAKMVQTISNVGTTTYDLALIYKDNKYLQYSAVDNFDQTVEEITKEEVEENLQNEELDIVLNRMPSTITKVSETTVDKDKLITYETSFKLSDLNTDEQTLFDNILLFYIGEVKKVPLNNIIIKQTIVLNASKEELVKITFDVNNFLREAFDNTGIGITITNTSGLYCFLFSNFNKVIKDESIFITHEEF